jgi:hypothetical protein
MKRETSKAVGIFIVIAGVVGVVVQVLTAPAGLRAISFVFLFVTLLFLGIWLVFQSQLRNRKAGRALPPIEQLEDICTGYQIAQATEDEIDWIARLEAQVYTPEDAIPNRVLMEWYEKNPAGFSVIKMTNGQKVGHIDILPLRPTTQKAFLQGHIVEKDVRGDSLYSPSERHLIRDLYVESIIVLPPKGFSKAPAILCVLTNFVSLVERICDPKTVQNVYAIAASQSGDRLLRRLGFDPIISSESRSDHHDLFSVKFSELTKNITAICGSRFPEVPARCES